MPISMMIDGVEGTGRGAYKGWIELESVQLGDPRSINAGGRATNREASVAMSEIVVTKDLDNTRAALYRLSALG